MRSIVLAWLVMTAPVSCGLKMLLIGDSLDRHAVDEFCNAASKRARCKLLPWGDPNLRYFDFMPQRCVLEGPPTSVVSVAQFHIYGTNATSPYHGWRSTPNARLTGIINTQPRMLYGLNTYLGEFGRPDRVMLATSTWDTMTTKELYGFPSPVWGGVFNATLGYFRRELIARIDEIFLVFAPNRTSNATATPLQIILRTGVQTLETSLLLPYLNDIIRDLAAERGLLLYDYDFDVWSSLTTSLADAEAYRLAHRATGQFNYPFNAIHHNTLFRDFIHPLPLFSIAAVRKMLGRLYSQWLPSDVKPFYLDYAADKRYYYARLERVRGSADVNYLDEGTGRIYKNITDDVMRSLRLTFYDIYHRDPSSPSSQELSLSAPPPLTAAAPLPSPNPESASDTYAYLAENAVCYDSARLMYYRVNQWRHTNELPSEAAAWAWVRANALSGTLPAALGQVQYPPAEFLPLLTMVPVAKDYSAKYIQEGMLIRRAGAREIFVIKNASKCLIPSMEAFFHYGSDFAQVVIVSAAELDEVAPGPTAS